jgi:Na+-translocating ferredoxin:NAD+ oxidoreductase RnfG subunit
MTDTEIVMTIVIIMLIVYAGVLSHIVYKIVRAMITDADKKKKNSLF